MFVLPSYHIHLSQLILPERTTPEQFSAAEDTDARLGRIEIVTIPGLVAKSDMPLVQGTSANVPVATFEKQDSFDVAGPAAENAPGEVVQVAFGVVHLFRTVEDVGLHKRGDEPGTASSPSMQASVSDAHLDTEEDEDSVGTILGMLALPSRMSPSELMEFIEPAAEAISYVRIVRELNEDRSLALLKFRESLDAEEFFKMYNRQPYSAVDVRMSQARPLLTVQPSDTCQLVYVTGVTASQTTVLPRPYPLLSSTEPWPVITSTADATVQPLLRRDSMTGVRQSAYELPTCPVCLERLDASVTGLVTVTCQHTFHCACLRRWTESRCPVCRYSQTRAFRETPGVEAGTAAAPPARSTHCHICQGQTDLWVCLICATVGCGRYHEGHAQQHYRETGHLYSLELETQRVWDYAGDGFVHRLIQSQTDGKLVELPSASSVAASTPERGSHAGASSGTAPRAGASAEETERLTEKLEAIGLEYSNLILSQLDSQRTHYEQRIAMLRAQSVPHDQHAELTEERDALRRECDEAHQRCTQLEKELATCKAGMTRHEGQLRRALDTARQYRQQYEEEKSVSDGLSANVHKLQEEQAAQQKRLAEMSEELRDLMFFVSARDKVEQTSAAGGEALAGGDVYVPEKGGKKGKSRK